MTHRNNLYKRYGLLTDRIGTLLGFSKKEAHAYIKDFKGVSSLKKLSNYQLWELNHELMAYLAENGIEFYFGEDLSDKTLHELNKVYESKNVDMIQETKNFNRVFWSYNYPVQLSRDEETGNTSYVIYLPRKERCWNSQEDDETVSPEELDAFIDNSIAKLKKGIELFEKYKAGEIDRVYYWDED